MSVGKRRAPLRSSGPPERRTRVKPVNRKRKAANVKRAYGPVERREWMKRQSCFACGLTRGIVFGTEVEIVSAHIVTGGTGRKADAHLTVPLCEREDGHGCHQLQHQFGWGYLTHLNTKAKREAAAATTEAAWQAHLHQQTGAGTT